MTVSATEVLRRHHEHTKSLNDNPGKCENANNESRKKEQNNPSLNLSTGLTTESVNSTSPIPSASNDNHLEHVPRDEQDSGENEAIPGNGRVIIKQDM